jgi:hypothetical protein
MTICFCPITEAFRANRLDNIRLLATDMDGTLTQQGKFTATLLQSLEALSNQGITVLIVTGRSAGWVDGIKSYLPVSGAIAENGGVFYSTHSEAPELLIPIFDPTLHRQHLAQAFQYLKTYYPHLQETTDNRFRITDWTFDVRGLTLQDLQHLAALCQEKGWGFTYSTVQCHIKPLQQNKASSLQQVLERYFPQIPSEQLLTIGDSPNDESLFDRSQFPLSVGVANILEYEHQLQHRPTYITTATEGKGFSEVANLVIQATRQNGNAIARI